MTLVTQGGIALEFKTKKLQNWVIFMIENKFFNSKKFTLGV